MADATRVPELVLFQWAKPDAPNPRLAAPISSTDTTITFTAAPRDKNGTIITGFFNFGIRNNAGYVENVHVPAAGMSVDGLTATGCIRGVGTSGYDYDTSVPGLATDHEQDSPVSCNVTAVLSALIEGALTGDIASTILFYLAANVPTYVDATARDAAITSPTNGMVVTTGGVLQYYSGGSWTDTGTGTATPNASPTVAGKVEIPLQAENDAGTRVGGTGAIFTAPPDIQAVTTQNNKWTYAGTTAGSSTAYTATLTPAPAAYVAGQEFSVLIDETNGVNPTINFNGLGAKNIVDSNGASIGETFLPAGALVNLKYNGTAFQVMSYSIGSRAIIYTSVQTRGDRTTQFDITNPSGSTFRYTWDGTGTNPNISLANFPIGTLVGIFSPYFSSGNCGVFPITNAGSNFFEINNLFGVAENNKILDSGFLNQQVDTFIVPPNAKIIEVVAIGGGGAGGKGAVDNESGAGGGGGCPVSKTFKASELGSSVGILVGQGGTNNTPGTGSYGGYSAFGSFLTAYGGGNGQSSSLRGGGGGAGTGGMPAEATPSSDTLGGLPATVIGANGIAGQGAGGGSSNGSCAEYGGAGGGNDLGGSSIFGAGAGGAGGRGATNETGSRGGRHGSYIAGGGAAGGAGGAGGGTTGSNGASRSGYGCGDGGGGGGGSSAGAGGAGGNGGVPGGGGGGGGGNVSGQSNGGNGGQGEVRVYVYY